MLTLQCQNRNGSWVNEDNTMTSETPVVCLAMNCALKVKFFGSSDSASALDLSGYSYKFYADADFNHLTAPKITAESGITYSNGYVTIPMDVGADVASWLGTAERKTIIGELQCWRSGEPYADIVLNFKFDIQNRVQR